MLRTPCVLILANIMEEVALVNDGPVSYSSLSMV